MDILVRLHRATQKQCQRSVYMHVFVILLRFCRVNSVYRDLRLSLVSRKRVLVS